MASIAVIETPELGDHSYLAHDGKSALVVDPQRDIERILQAASHLGVRIAVVAETHLHNDYVSGGLELARRTGATYLVSAEDDVGFERHPIRDGDELAVGTMAVRAVSTPGHTLHHMSYLLLDQRREVALFSGGCLLYGTVGRTDLVSSELTETLTRAQHRSAWRLAAQVPGDVEVHPTHGFGSFCSSSKPSGVVISTVGHERKDNLALQIEDEDEFVRVLLGGLSAYPRYYAHMGPINRLGPPPANLGEVRELDAKELAHGIDSGSWVIDLRSRKAFARSHIEGTVSFELGDLFPTYIGWVLPWGSKIMLIGDSSEQVREAQRKLSLIGIDELGGVAVGEVGNIIPGRPLRNYQVADFKDLAKARAQNDILILDVRRDDELSSASWIQGSLHIPLHDLIERISEVPRQTVWVHCGVGYRASIAASLLDRAGYDVVVVDDDFDNARNTGLVL